MNVLLALAAFVITYILASKLYHVAADLAALATAKAVAALVLSL